MKRGIKDKFSLASKKNVCSNWSEKTLGKYVEYSRPYYKSTLPHLSNHYNCDKGKYNSFLRVICRSYENSDAVY